MSSKKNAKEAPAPTAATGTPIIEIKRPNLQTRKLTIYGTAPLIQHKWSEKAKKQILDNQMKKAKEALAAKDPQQDYEDSIYKLPGGRYGFPAVAFKSAAVRAGKLLGLPMTDARQMFFVVADEEDLVIINGHPSPREDMVKIPGTVDIRYRAEFREWSAVLTVRFNADLISEEQVMNLFESAGFSVGVGEWRPEKNGMFGTFTLLKGDK
jgi:hypothetical protein